MSNKAKQEASDKWAIRITAPWDFIRERIVQIREQIDFVGLMVGYHVGKQGKRQPHAHLVLQLNKALQKQSIDVRYKKLFDVKGELYSSKIWDGNKKALSYLYHDEEGHVENHMGLTDAEIEEIKSMNQEIQKVVKKNAEKASHKVVDYVLRKIKESEMDLMVWTRYEIAVCILTAIADGEFYDPGDFMIERYINEIELKANRQDKHLLRAVIDARIQRLPSFRR